MAKIKIKLPPLHAGRENREMYDDIYGGRESYDFGGQIAVKKSGARNKIIYAGRRWGKSMFGLEENLEYALQLGFTWWIWPTRPNAREGWDFLKLMTVKQFLQIIKRSTRLPIISDLVGELLQWLKWLVNQSFKINQWL